ncbi:MAG: HNH endonuclease [Clostridium sp.]|jgi:5-methylcytosine-specific restriction enzyme A|nr:HNH endonuclease [Clostridium sp.]
MPRLKSCVYCGGVHSTDFNCHRKPIRSKNITKANKFRNTAKWQKKRKEIKHRDKYICQVCYRNLYNTIKRINYENIEVHHITPIEEDITFALDNDYLVSLCVYHHKLADADKIPREELKTIAAEQNRAV